MPIKTGNEHQFFAHRIVRISIKLVQIEITIRMISQIRKILFCCLEREVVSCFVTDVPNQSVSIIGT
ncbi:hypothetical protein BOO69_00950 [Sulfitobacter alexandrii]|uniref:Uncharacterized protein n=1 Tax=Sulfitobacter alexandrii TaxID=1917485 RepID=A0A1J0WCV7_9RHOB|nr:hypothetical protein BOO69_00950 [Sulfitobacter alexandrii]